MNPRVALFASFMLGLGLTVGCGGSSNSDLLSGGGSQNTGTGATSTGGGNNGGSNNGGSAGKNNGGTGNNGNNGGSGNNGNNGGSGNNGNNGGSGNNGNTGGTGNTGNTGGSGGGNTGAGVVQCGGTPCNVSQGGTCCASIGGFTCAPGDCQTQATPIKCDGPEDCPGQICCGTVSQYGYYYTQVVCSDTCSGTRNHPFCGNDPNSCPSGTQCVNSQLLPGFQVCG